MPEMDLTVVLQSSNSGAKCIRKKCWDDFKVF